MRNLSWQRSPDVPCSLQVDVCLPAVCLLLGCEQCASQIFLLPLTLVPVAAHTLVATPRAFRRLPHTCAWSSTHFTPMNSRVSRRCGIQDKQEECRKRSCVKEKVCPAWAGHDPAFSKNLLLAAALTSLWRADVYTNSANREARTEALSQSGHPRAERPVRVRFIQQCANTEGYHIASMPVLPPHSRLVPNSLSSRLCNSCVS